MDAHFRAIYESATKLLGGDFLQEIGIDEAYRLYNGIGAEWMPPKVREAITRHWRIFEPAALIHDVQFALWKDRSLLGFRFVNCIFLCNCVRLSKDSYKWYSPRRYICIRAGRLMYSCLDDFGLRAWKYAGETSES